MEKLLADIKKHALQEFPKECVGYVKKGRYHRLTNVANQPTKRYQLSTADKWLIISLGDSLDALGNSHPGMDNAPSGTDTMAQKSCGFPFWIIGTDGVNTTEIKEVS